MSDTRWEKRIVPVFVLSKKIMCPNMKLTTLMDVYNVCRAVGSDEAKDYEITMDAELITKARVCIDEMLRLGG